eukprot:3788183-Lingulodinium_polyedra.AAC.1
MTLRCAPCALLAQGSPALTAFGCSRQRRFFSVCGWFALRRAVQGRGVRRETAATFSFMVGAESQPARVRGRFCLPPAQFQPAA